MVQGSWTPQVMAFCDMVVDKDGEGEEGKRVRQEVQMEALQTFSLAGVFRT